MAQVATHYVRTCHCDRLQAKRRNPRLHNLRFRPIPAQVLTVPAFRAMMSHNLLEVRVYMGIQLYNIRIRQVPGALVSTCGRSAP
jgi:hypothetical protein